MAFYQLNRTYQPSLFAEQARIEAVRKIYTALDEAGRRDPVKRYEKTMSIKEVIKRCDTF